MTPEALKEILSNIEKPDFWSNNSGGDEQADELGCKYQTDPESLCSGDCVTITDQSEPLNDRRQQLAEKIGIRFCEMIEEELTNDEFTLRDELADDWVFDAEPELKLEPVCLSIIAMVHAAYRIADPIVINNLTLTPELLAVIRERERERELELERMNQPT
jgi:hypothetical protein